MYICILGLATLFMDTDTFNGPRPSTTSRQGILSSSRVTAISFATCHRSHLHFATCCVTLLTHTNIDVN